MPDSKYLEFIESARVKLFAFLGISFDHLSQVEQLTFVLHKIQCEHLYPAKLNDLLHIYGKVLEVNSKRIIIRQSIYLAENQRNVANFDIEFACLDLKRKRPMRFPNKYVQLFEKIKAIQSGHIPEKDNCFIDN